jgi:hypothetical protein
MRIKVTSVEWTWLGLEVGTVHCGQHQHVWGGYKCMCMGTDDMMGRIYTYLPSHHHVGAWMINDGDVGAAQVSHAGRKAKIYDSQP